MRKNYWPGGNDVVSPLASSGKKYRMAAGAMVPVVVSTKEEIDVVSEIRIRSFGPKPGNPDKIRPGGFRMRKHWPNKMSASEIQKSKGQEVWEAQYLNKPSENRVIAVDPAFGKDYSSTVLIDESGIATVVPVKKGGRMRLRHVGWIVGIAVAGWLVFWIGMILNQLLIMK